jgi:hypothetical protein
MGDQRRYSPQGGLSLCCRIWASVLRFQIATAIPPRAAEVASNRLVRQKLRSGAESRATGASFAGTDSILSVFGLGKLRRGIGDLIKKTGKDSPEQLFF